MKRVLTQKMMKRLLVIGMAKKLLVLIILAFYNILNAEGLTTEQFISLYPNAEQEGACYVLRLDDCNVIAVENDYASPHEISLIFVQGKQQAKSLLTAKKIAQDIPDNTISPFIGSEPSVAIFCPTSDMSTKSPLNVLLSPTSTASKTTKFTGWQGKNVKAQVDLSTLTTSSGKKTKAGVVEMMVNLEEATVTCAEFRIIKGKTSSSDMRDFINERMNSYSSAASLPSLSAKSKKDLRALYANHEILAYSSSYDFCIANKGKIYRAGTLEGVKEAVRNNKRDNIAFKFPSNNHPWPENHSEGDDITIERITDATEKDEYNMVNFNLCIDANEFVKKFPGTHISTSVKGGNVFRLDNSRVMTIANTWLRKENGSSKTKNDLMLILVTSDIDKGDATRTAQKLAKYLPDNSLLQPLKDSNNTCAIFLPNISSISQDKDSPLQVIFYPRPGYQKKLQFINYQGGLLTIRYNHESSGASGVLEITMDPAENLKNSVVDLSIVEGNVDIQNFLKDGRINALAFKDLGVVNIGKNSYRLGTDANILSLGKNGYQARNYETPKQACQWPDEASSKSTNAETPQRNSTPSPEEIQTIDQNSGKEVRMNEGLLQRTDLPSNPQLTPAEAYRQYLESLKKI